MTNKRISAIERRRLAYVRLFLGPDGKLNPAAAEVMADLKRFSGVRRGGLVVSPQSRMVDIHATIYRNGLRDMYMRIVEFLNLDESTLPEAPSYAITEPGD